MPLDPAASEVAEDAKWLLERRKDYFEDIAWWKFMRECRQGGRAWKHGRNLPPHILETESSSVNLLPGTAGGGGATTGRRARAAYELRLEQLGRFNLVDDVISALGGYVDANPPNRDGLPEIPGLAEFVERADPGHAEGLTGLMAAAARDAMSMSVAWRGVDAHVTANELRAMVGEEPAEEAGAAPPVLPADALAQLGDAAIPYVYDVEPEDMLQAEFDSAGKLIKALVREWHLSGDPDGNAAREPAPVYRHWTIATSTLYELRKGAGGRLEAVVLEEDANAYGLAFGHLALFRICPYAVKATPCRGRAEVEDIALIDRMLADVLSSFTFHVTNAADTKINITAPIEAFAGKNENEQADYVNSLVESGVAPVAVVSTGTAIEAMPRDFAQAALMLDAFERLYALALQSKGLGDKVSNRTQPESGIAKFRAFQMLNSTLVRIGQELAKAEVAILRAAAFYLGGEAVVKKIGKDASSYPRSYDVADVEALVALRVELDGKAPAEVLNWITAQIMRKAFPDRDADTMQEHEDALDGFEPAENSLGGMVARFGREAGGKRPPPASAPIAFNEALADA